MKLKELREDAGFTQKYVARILNVGQNTYSQYESGKRGLTCDALIILALLYDTSADYILGITDVQEPYLRKKT